LARETSRFSSDPSALRRRSFNDSETFTSNKVMTDKPEDCGENNPRATQLSIAYEMTKH